MLVNDPASLGLHVLEAVGREVAEGEEWRGLLDANQIGGRDQSQLRRKLLTETAFPGFRLC